MSKKLSVMIDHNIILLTNKVKQYHNLQNSTIWFYKAKALKGEFPNALHNYHQHSMSVIDTRVCPVVVKDCSETDVSVELSASINTSIKLS